MSYIEQCLYEGVALENLYWDLDEMSDLDGFLEWLMYDPELDEGYFDTELGCWVYPDEYDLDDDDEDYEY